MTVGAYLGFILDFILASFFCYLSIWDDNALLCLMRAAQNLWDWGGLCVKINQCWEYNSDILFFFKKGM